MAGIAAIAATRLGRGHVPVPRTMVALNLPGTIVMLGWPGMKKGASGLVLPSIRVLALLLVLSLFGAAWASEKKGVGLAELQAGDRIAALNLAWYYTWKPYPVEGAPPEKFVPMLRSRGGRVLDEQIAYFRSQGRLPQLLAFNEPNLAKGDDMTVEAVIQRWPEIAELADQLGSPAPSGVLGPWFDAFFRQLEARGMKLDFMAVHLYSPPDPENFLKKIDAVYEKYRLPIWITEFAVADWDALKKPKKNRFSEDDVLAFMKAVLPELEKRSYVVRYAWFGAGDYVYTHEEVRTSRLFEKDGSLTPLGHYYSEFNWPAKDKNLDLQVDR